MKTINKYLFLLATAVFAFTACEDEIKRPVSPAFEGKAVFFPVSEESAEVEPTAVLAHEIKIARDTINNSALSVKLVVATNTQNIFEVPETVEFAAGVTETTFVVKFPQAQIDSTYTLAIELEADNSNPYLVEKPTYKFTVNIAKWDLVTNKQAIIFDGIVNVFYGTGNPGWYVSYARKNNADGSFDIRLLNPYTVLPEYKDGNVDDPIADEFGLYGGFPYNYPEDVDSKGTYNMTIHVSAKGQATFDQFALGMAWSYGMFYGAHATSKGYGSYDKATKAITFPGGTVACAMADYKEGGFYLGSEDLIINLDDSLWKDINSVITVASLKDGFNDASLTWNDIPGELSTLVTTIQPEVGLIDVKFQNCVDPNPKDKQGPGSDFYNLYRLADVYAPDYCLAFHLDTVKNKVALPVALQPTGLEFAGKKLFVGPSAENDSYVEDAVLGGKQAKLFHFFLQLQTKDGGNLGEYEEVFYYCDEKIVWGEKPEDFVGTYKLTGPSQFSGQPDADLDTEIALEDGKLVLYGVEYCSGLAVEFDDATKTISIAPQLQDSLYGAYDITFYTTTIAGDVSVTEPIVLSMGFGGIISLDESTGADGYLVRSEAAGGWLAGNYDIKLTPAAPAKAPAKAPAIEVKRTLGEHKHVAATPKAGFKLQGKLPKHNFRFLQ